MASSICWNNPRETITSGIWKMIEQPWRTTLAPIFGNRSRNVIGDQFFASSGNARDHQFEINARERQFEIQA